MIVGALLTTFHLSLPFDDLATQLKPGAHFTTWPVEGLYEDINEDRRVVFLFSIEQEGISEDIERMNTIAQDEDIPSTLGLITDGSEQLTTLMFQYGAAFPTGALEPRFARNLYRTLPRTFILENGYVQATWSKIPTLKEVSSELQLKSPGQQQ